VAHGKNWRKKVKRFFEKIKKYSESLFAIFRGTFEPLRSIFAK
jgi:hypothetical protein